MNNIVHKIIMGAPTVAYGVFLGVGIIGFIHYAPVVSLVVLGFVFLLFISFAVGDQIVKEEAREKEKK